MSLGLHVDCRSRVTEILANAFAKVQVKNKMFVHRPSLVWMFEADLALPQKGRLRESLVNYIDEYPVFEFAHGTLAQWLFEKDEYEAGNQLISLNDLSGFENPKRLASKIIEQFESLPWRYAFSFKMPDEVASIFSRIVNEVDLSNDVRLITPTSKMDSQFPLLSGDEKRDKDIHGSGLLSLFTDDPVWNQSASYLQVEVDGFVGRYGGTNPVLYAESLLRAFCGLAIALRIFKMQHEPAPVV